MRNPGRAEIARAIPPGSRRCRSQREALAALTADPALAELRADFRQNICDVWREMVRRASWRIMTTSPTREKIRALVRGRDGQLLGMSTWKRCRRWLEEHGWLGCVIQGSTPQLDGMRTSPALIDPAAANTAAVYVLAIPRKKRMLPPPPGLLPVSGPPSGSRREPAKVHAPAGEDTGGNRPRSRAGSLPAMAGQMRKGPGQGITDGWCAHLAGPFIAAGYSPADLRHAIDHDPGGGQHRHRLDRVAHPAGWLRARLARWLEPDETGAVPWKERRPVLARSLQAAVSRQADRASQVRWRQAAAEASAGWADPAGPAAAIREQHGWRKP